MQQIPCAIQLVRGDFRRYLSEKVMDKLEIEHSKVYLPLSIPIND
jgi:hypothetical protein